MLSRKAGNSGWVIENIEYGQDVAFDIIVPEEAENELIRYCLDLTGGALQLKDPVSLLTKGESVEIS
jgi:hypothetical protein